MVDITKGTTTLCAHILNAQCTRDTFRPFAFSHLLT